MKKLVLSLLSALCVASPNWSAAADLTISGRASVEYQPAVKATRQTAAEEAQKEAIRNGLDAMMSSQSSTMRQLYEERKPDIYTTLMSHARDVQNTQKDNKATHSMEVKVSAVIDDDKLKDTLMNTSVANKTVNLSDSLVAMLFTVRSVASVEKDGGTTKSTSSSSATGDSSVAESETDSAITTSESRSEVKTSESSSSRIFKSDVKTYRVETDACTAFDAALSERLLDKGYAEAFGRDSFDSVELLDEVYGAGKSVPASALRKIVTEIRELDPSVEYMIIGTLDFGYPRKDAMTGMVAVDAKVSGIVYELVAGKVMYKRHATLSPQSITGKGADESQAKDRALISVSPLAADEILAKLKARKGRENKNNN
ncbi:MAG: hypothetical protein IJE66_08000 [Akkermansia sp.]|nr:hypothetical protein [Akkermansia sp.]